MNKYVAFTDDSGKTQIGKMINNLELYALDGKFRTIGEVEKSNFKFLNPQELGKLLFSNPEHALSVIEDYQGHHTKGIPNRFQFNVKMYDLRFPTTVEELFEESQIMNYYNYILLDSHIDSSLSEIKEIVDWVDDYYFAGRSNGYLVLIHKNLSKYTSLREMLESGEYDTEYVISNIYTLATDLLLLDRYIKDSIKSFVDYVVTEEAWEELLDLVRNEHIVCPHCRWRISKES